MQFNLNKGEKFREYNLNDEKILLKLFKKMI